MILSHAADGEDLAMNNDVDSRREHTDPQDHPIVEGPKDPQPLVCT
jgi:hypothetical protein